MRFIRNNAIALIALVFAMTGTGVAASRYLITSTSQIKPSVIATLHSRGSQGPEGAQGSTGPQGATGPAGPAGPQGPAGSNAASTMQVQFFTGVAAEYSPVFDISGYKQLKLITACTTGIKSEERVGYVLEWSADSAHWQEVTPTGDTTRCDFEKEFVESPVVARYVRVRLYNNGEAAKLIDPPSSIEMSAWLTD